MGGTRRHLDRLAARRERLAGQVRDRSTGSTANSSGTSAASSACTSWSMTAPPRRRVRVQAGEQRRAPRGGRSHRVPAPTAAGLATTARSSSRTQMTARSSPIGGSTAGPSIRTGRWTTRCRSSWRKRLGLEQVQPAYKDRLVVLEGGSIDVNGRGTLLTTEECLLSPIQARNPGFTRAGSRSDVSPSISAFATRCGSGTASPATTLTATWTTSPVSSRRARSSSQSKRIRPKRITSPRKRTGSSCNR